MCTGSELKIIGAAKEKDFLPLADFMFWVPQAGFPSERNDLTGICQSNNSDK